MDFTPVPSRQRTGWTAEKQRQFIETLAITGSVVDASTGVMMTARSAYVLRTRPEASAFAAAWDMALQQAGGRLLSHAFERALKGGCRRVWKDGELTIEEQNPSDKLLMWLIARIGPAPFRTGTAETPLATTAQIEAELERLTDALPDQPGITNADFHQQIDPPTSVYGD
ncbi:MAG: hypothetical protein ACRC1J_06600 [Sandaracinobacteroides sp.]